MRPTSAVKSLWEGLASLRLTILLLALLMLLVTLCTLAQVSLGTLGAVQIYIRNIFLYWTMPGTGWKVPMFPAGGAVGLLLFFNLLASQASRLELKWRKAGLWLSHAGILLLILGEFVTGMWQVESHMTLDEGSTKNYSESFHDSEVAVIDASAPDHDKVVSIPDALLRRKRPISHPALPFTLKVLYYYPNSALGMAGQGEPSGATMGVGANVSVREIPPVSADTESNMPSALLEAFSDGKSLGTWLLSSGLGAPQSLRVQGQEFQLGLRPRRFYLPFSLHLKDFRHDVYPGTDIPKNFSSLVRLTDPGKGEDRDVLISMNHPLRHRGKSFYQASFGKEDTLSILQVVENPGRLIPYISCSMVFAGLMLHFGLLHLFPFLKERRGRP